MTEGDSKSLPGRTWIQVSVFEFGSTETRPLREVDPSEDRGTEGKEEACQAPSPHPSPLWGLLTKD